MTRISRRLKHLVLIPLYTLVFFIAAVTVQAATYYVATTGTDANPGTQSQPFGTITRGVRALQAGDTLYIGGGTYVERLDSATLAWPSGTSWTNAVTISAYPGASVTLRPGVGGSVVTIAHQTTDPPRYIIFNNLILDGINSESESVIQISQGAHHTRWQNIDIKNGWNNGVIIGWGIVNNLSSDYHEFINCIVHHNGRDGSSQDPITGANIPGPDTQPGLGRGHGFYVSTSHNLVQTGLIYQNGEYGLKFYDSSTTGIAAAHTSNFNVIRESTLHHNGQNTTRLGHPVGGGILLATGTDNQAINNVVHNHSDINLQGIVTGYTKPVSNSVIYNNIVYNSGIGIQTTPSSTNALVKNNIVYLNSNLPTYDLGVGTTWSNNLIQINPQFVDAAAGNFRLLSTSPAIDKGATLTEVTKDIVGVPRPQGTAYDIGAYETPSGSDSVPPSAPRNLTVN